MSRWSRLVDLVSGRFRSTGDLASRHERREAARLRHRESGEPLWTPVDRHLGPNGRHEVSDIAPGLPGHSGSVRTIEDD